MVIVGGPRNLAKELWQIHAIESRLSGPNSKKPGSTYWRLRLISEDGKRVEEPNIFMKPTFPLYAWIMGDVTHKDGHTNIVGLEVVQSEKMVEDPANRKPGQLPTRVPPKSNDEALIQMHEEVNYEAQHFLDPQEEHPAAKGHRENMEMWTKMNLLDENLIKELQSNTKAITELVRIMKAFLGRE
jgi:hypothetical protein